ASKLVDRFHINIIVDIGANQGGFSLALVSRYQELKAFLIEPVKRNAECIARNANINGVEKNIHILKIAIHNFRGKGIMNIKTLSDATLVLSNSPNIERGNVEDVKVLPFGEVYGYIKKVAKGQNISVLVKIDAQGSESGILQSIARIQPEHLEQIKIVIVEVHKFLRVDEEQIKTIMNDLGFHLLMKIPLPFESQPHLYFIRRG
ncbi:MAG: FkbM family methyltransferase, partial [Caldanaerobacter sp.]